MAALVTVGVILIVAIIVCVGIVVIDQRRRGPASRRSMDALDTEVLAQYRSLLAQANLELAAGRTRSARMLSQQASDLLTKVRE